MKMMTDLNEAENSELSLTVSKSFWDIPSSLSYLDIDE